MLSPGGARLATPKSRALTSESWTNSSKRSASKPDRVKHPATLPDRRASSAPATCAGKSRRHSARRRRGSAGRFATDSPLERAGFEPSVQRCARTGRTGTAVPRSDRRRPSTQPGARKGATTQVHRARVLQVRIHLPPAESLQTFGSRSRRPADYRTRHAGYGVKAVAWREGGRLINSSCRVGPGSFTPSRSQIRT